MVLINDVKDDGGGDDDGDDGDDGDDDGDGDGDDGDDDDDDGGGDDGDRDDDDGDGVSARCLLCALVRHGEVRGPTQECQEGVGSSRWALGDFCEALVIVLGGGGAGHSFGRECTLQSEKVLEAIAIAE